MGREEVQNIVLKERADRMLILSSKQIFLREISSCSIRLEVYVLVSEGTADFMEYVFRAHDKTGQAQLG